MTTWKTKQKKAPWTRMRGGIKPRGWKKARYVSAKETIKILRADAKAGFAKSSTKPKRICRKPIRRVSPARAKQLREYAIRRLKFLKGKKCAVFHVWPATEIHHRLGRIGNLLNDETKWVPVSDIGYRWIHRNPKWAKENGFIGENWNSTTRTKHQRR